MLERRKALVKFRDRKKTLGLIFASLLLASLACSLPLAAPPPGSSPLAAPPPSIGPPPTIVWNTNTPGPITEPILDAQPATTPEPPTPTLPPTVTLPPGAVDTSPYPYY